MAPTAAATPAAAKAKFIGYMPPAVEGEAPSAQFNLTEAAGAHPVNDTVGIDTLNKLGVPFDPPPPYNPDNLTEGAAPKAPRIVVPPVAGAPDVSGDIYSKPVDERIQKLEELQKALGMQDKGPGLPPKSVGAAAANDPTVFETSGAVSYTHLDVYKRQAQHSF